MYGVYGEMEHQVLLKDYQRQAQCWFTGGKSSPGVWRFFLSTSFLRSLLANNPALEVLVIEGTRLGDADDILRCIALRCSKLRFLYIGGHPARSALDSLVERVYSLTFIAVHSMVAPPSEWLPLTDEASLKLHFNDLVRIDSAEAPPCGEWPKWMKLYRRAQFL